MDERDASEVARILIGRFWAAAPMRIRRRVDSHLSSVEKEGAEFRGAVLAAADAILDGHRPLHRLPSAIAAQPTTP